VDEKGDGSVEENPEVEGPLGHVGDFFIFGMNWDFLVEFEGVDVCDLD